MLNLMKVSNWNFALQLTVERFFGVGVHLIQIIKFI